MLLTRCSPLVTVPSKSTSVLRLSRAAASVMTPGEALLLGGGYRTAVIVSRRNWSHTSATTNLTTPAGIGSQSTNAANFQQHRRRWSSHTNTVNNIQIRWASALPLNTGIMFVPQQEAWLVERMGAFHRVLQPGLNLLIPIIDRVKYVQSLKEIAIDIPQQSAITSDNVGLNIDGVLYLKVQDPYKASYGVEDPEFAITQLAQTTMRSELGKISLDSVFKERESLNFAIVEAINKASAAWGIDCLRYEIRDIRLPARVTEAMQMQVEAERKKRAAILESEGVREAEVNVAEGRKISRVLASEAQQIELINKANGEAEALRRKARAKADALRSVSEALGGKGRDAASLAVAEQYVTAFSQLAKESNTVLLPSNSGDMSSMVAQALGIYQKLQSPPLRTGQLSRSEAAGENGTDPGEYIESSDDGRGAPSQPASSTNYTSASNARRLEEENDNDDDHRPTTRK